MSYSLVPETAPFTPEQRAWLNGFLAGWIGLDAPGRAAQGLPTAAIEALGAIPPPAAEPGETFAWHDPNLTIVERLNLSEGKPFPRRLMAAMAQLDCGACGYVCQTYAEAIAGGAEKNLTLCSPGGKNTAKAIKQLIKDEGGGATGKGSNAATVGANGHTAQRDAAEGRGYGRTHPFLAPLVSTRNLNKPGSAKHTTHVVLSLAGSGLTYKVGDALGVYATNAPELVEEILAVTRLDAAGMVTGSDGAPMSLGDALRHRACLRTASEDLLHVLARTAATDEEREAIETAIVNESFDDFDVLDAVRMAAAPSMSPAAFFAALTPLAPRLYSIASSPAAHPGEVHLTVGRVAYEQNGRRRLGVASTMFSDRLQAGDVVGVFIHEATDFTIPTDPSAPMIMVGPGTGIAPFRAFLEERHASGAAGKNWLFFGDQCAATDFLYRDELEGLRQSGCLTRLDAAFSRDQAHKVYVQDRMLERGAELFKWLEEGAHFFVCGDATRMAADVDRGLHELVSRHGSMPADAAQDYVNRLKAQKRYVRDVY